MKGFEPSLLEKLFDDEPRSPATGSFKRFSMEQFKESVAKDLEALLNTRFATTDEELKRYPQAQSSVITFGLKDFSGMSLANSFDREAVCRSLELSIKRHEPRLKSVKVSLQMEQGSSGSLNFSIKALLLAYPASEPVSFDAMLQPSTLQYAVRNSRRMSAV
jgi:type VI secretion system protein ImpF